METFKKLAIERETGELYFVLDYNVTCDFFELFETPEVKNIIFLQSVVMEVTFIFYLFVILSKLLRLRSILFLFITD
jgi:hypothetical protein